MAHEWVPLSLIAATGAGAQVPAQGVPGGALLHDPLQHLSDPAGHIHAGLRRALVPQQLYVSSTKTSLSQLPSLSSVVFCCVFMTPKCVVDCLVIEYLPQTQI